MKKEKLIIALLFSVITVMISQIVYGQSDSVVATVPVIDVAQATHSIDSVFEANDSLQHVADSLIVMTKPSVDINLVNKIFGNTTVVSPIQTVLYILLGFLGYCIIYFRKAYHDNFKRIGSFNFPKWVMLNLGSVIMYLIFIGIILITKISLPISGAILLGLMPKMIINAVKKEFDSLKTIADAANNQ